MKKCVVCGKKLENGENELCEECMKKGFKGLRKILGKLKRKK